MRYAHHHVCKYSENGNRSRIRICNINLALIPIIFCFTSTELEESNSRMLNPANHEQTIHVLFTKESRQFIMSSFLLAAIRAGTQVFFVPPPPRNNRIIIEPETTSPMQVESGPKLWNRYPMYNAKYDRFRIKSTHLCRPFTSKMPQPFFKTGVW